MFQILPGLFEHDGAPEGEHKSKIVQALPPEQEEFPTARGQAGSVRHLQLGEPRAERAEIRQTNAKD